MALYGMLWYGMVWYGRQVAPDVPLDQAVGDHVLLLTVMVLISVINIYDQNRGTW